VPEPSALRFVQELKYGLICAGARANGRLDIPIVFMPNSSEGIENMSRRRGCK
jgi:hypothetical protein